MTIRFRLYANKYQPCKTVCCLSLRHLCPKTTRMSYECFKQPSLRVPGCWRTQSKQSSLRVSGCWRTQSKQPSLDAEGYNPKWPPAWNNKICFKWPTLRAWTWISVLRLRIVKLAVLPNLVNHYIVFSELSSKSFGNYQKNTVNLDLIYKKSTELGRYGISKSTTRHRRTPAKMIECGLILDHLKYILGDM